MARAEYRALLDSDAADRSTSAVAPALPEVLLPEVPQRPP